MELRDYVIIYFDAVIRGLIAFVFVGIGLYLFLVAYLKTSAFLVLPIAFVFSILISPLLSRVKLGERTLVWYENLLEKLFSKTLGEKNEKR